MAWEVYSVAEVDAWMLSLDRRTFVRVVDAIEQLKSAGPGLGRPAVDTIVGSRHSNLKELRAGSIRILFAFDPTRRAVLLVAGDKAGLWDRWYRKAVPLADRRYDEWLARMVGKEGEDGR